MMPGSEGNHRCVSRGKEWNIRSASDDRVLIGNSHVGAQSTHADFSTL